MPADFRIAARLLLKSPFYTAAAVLILGIAIAGNTAIFSAANVLLLGPLPYADADRLLVLASIERPTGARAGVSYPELRDWTRDPSVFEGAAAVQLEQGYISGIDETGPRQRRTDDGGPAFRARHAASAGAGIRAAG